MRWQGACYAVAGWQGLHASIFHHPACRLGILLQWLPVVMDLLPTCFPLCVPALAAYSLNKYHYSGIGCCVVGITLVGVSSMLSGAFR